MHALILEYIKVVSPIRAPLRGTAQTSAQDAECKDPRNLFEARWGG